MDLLVNFPVLNEHPWSISDFEPTHVGGTWASRERWRPALEKLRLALHQSLIEAARLESFPFKPRVFASQIHDLFVYIEDRDGPEWWAQVSFDFFTQGRSVDGKYLEAAYRLTPQTPTYLWWDNFNGVPGCVFDPGTFHVSRFSWRVPESELVARGFPTRHLDRVWKEKNWYASSYWSRQTRPVSSLVQQVV